ncbi:MAG: hypothetical protein R6X15_04035 [Pseudomonadota bacterium]
MEKPSPCFEFILVSRREANTGLFIVKPVGDSDSVIKSALNSLRPLRRDNMFQTLSSTAIHGGVSALALKGF